MQVSTADFPGTMTHKNRFKLDNHNWSCAQFKCPSFEVNVVLNMLQVYVAAGAVYSLEAELSDLEECARGICSGTSDMELSFLEEQVASAAAKVQQSELQVGSSWIRTHFIAGNGILREEVFCCLLSKYQFV